MPLPTIYNTGTASVANGATTITIVGAVSNAIYAGDLFMDPAQPLVPPQRIASVTGGGVYELAVGWPGAAMTSDPYEVRFTHDGVRTSERTRQLIEKMSVVEANGRGLFYLFATATADADPGAGYLRLNNATPGSATAAYLDNLDANGAAVPAILDTWDDAGASGGRGQLWVRSVASPATFHAYSVTGSVVDGTGYRKLTLSYIGGSGSLVADDELMVDFVPVGEKGEAASASYVPFTPTGDLTSIDTQAAIVEVNGKIAAAAAGVARRGTVRAATTANITIATALNNGDSLDGVTLATGDLVLVKNQAAPAENGVYVVGTSPARSSEFDTYNEHPGAMIVVQEGTTLADSFWYCTSNAGGTLGSSSIVFAQLSLTPADGSITYAKMAAGVVREALTANRTYYVRADGSDSNNGLVDSAGGAFLTIAKALTAAAALDCSTFNLTIQVRDGTYTGVSLPRMLGSGTFTLVGNTTTPGSCILSRTGGDAVAGVDTHNSWTVNGFKLQTTTSGNGLTMAGTGRIRFLNIDFGTIAGAHHISASGPGAVIEATGNWTISGNSAYAHMTATYGGQLLAYGKTITLSGSRAFTIFALSQGVAAIDTGSLTFTGAAIGQRYLAAMNGIINTSGGGANFFPGGTAGATATGGQYA